MATKKKIEEVEAEELSEGITPFAHRFGREDMDALVDKLNEVVETVNNL